MLLIIAKGKGGFILVYFPLMSQNTPDVVLYKVRKTLISQFWEQNILNQVFPLVQPLMAT